MKALLIGNGGYVLYHLCDIFNASMMFSEVRPGKSMASIRPEFIEEGGVGPPAL